MHHGGAQLAHAAGGAAAGGRRVQGLAGIGTKSCAVSCCATLALLLAFGPIASLGGMLLGELVILFSVPQLARRLGWRSHG